MVYPKEIKKVSDHQLVFPVDDLSNIGNSLSALNFNFSALDIYTCNFEYSATNFYDKVYSLFNSNSAHWVESMNTFRSHSACWEETYDTVRSLSAIWLKPISLIYPYPFNVDGSSITIQNEVQTWVNINLPVNSALCTNFIAGQELFIFTPQYSNINKIITKEQSFGLKTVQVTFTTFCIGRQTDHLKQVPVDCGGMRLDVAVADTFIGIITGLKFVVNPEGTAWIFDSNLYD